jgi:poly(3-hydroxybutyrate) depolymerase
VLYPQTRQLGVNAFGLANPSGCWDWWGYLDADPTEHPTYLLKTGKQIRAIKSMVDRIGHAPPASPVPGPTPIPATAEPAVPDRSDTAVDIVWRPIPGVARYDVLRADAGGIVFRPIGVVTGSSYADSGLKPATLYRYEIRASTSDGSAPLSPPVSAITLKRVALCNDPGHCAAD